MIWQKSPRIKSRVDKIIRAVFPHLDTTKISVVIGYGSTGRAIARIWSFPKPWQLVLNLKPRYIIEVISERFTKLGFEDQDKVLIHELMHIPKTFSGSLVPHRNRGRHITNRNVDLIYNQYKNKK